MGSTLLGDDEAQTLVDTCRTVIGDSLRSITYFSRTDYDQIYLRQDLERDADLSEFIGHEWRAFQHTQDVYGESELGDYEYTIRVFENGFLLRIALESEGVFVTTDGLTMTDFSDVASAIRKTLQERHAVPGEESSE